MRMMTQLLPQILLHIIMESDYIHFLLVQDLYGIQREVNQGAN